MAQWNWESRMSLPAVDIIDREAARALGRARERRARAGVPAEVTRRALVNGPLQTEAKCLSPGPHLLVPPKYHLLPEAFPDLLREGLCFLLHFPTSLWITCHCLTGELLRPELHSLCLYSLYPVSWYNIWLLGKLQTKGQGGGRTQDVMSVSSEVKPSGSKSTYCCTALDKLFTSPSFSFLSNRGSSYFIGFLWELLKPLSMVSGTY